MKILSVLAVLFLACGMVAADEVVLKSGGKVTGIATEKGDKVIVEVGVGTVTFDKSQVLTIKRGKTPLHEFKKKLDAVKDSTDANEHYNLAMFAKENGLGKYVREHLQRAVELNPDHESARRALGFQLHKGSWMTEDEIYRERGFVKFEGKWMTPAEVQLIRQHRLELKMKKLAMEVERKKKREEERQQRLEERRAYQERLAELARQRELERQMRRYRNNNRSYGSYYGPGYGYYGGFGGAYGGGYGFGDGIDPWQFLRDHGYTHPGVKNPGGGVNPFQKK